MRGGHYRDVRCAEWFLPAAGAGAAGGDAGAVLVTGGEDGRLCQWRRRAGGAGFGSAGKASGGRSAPSAGRVSKHASRAKKRHASPY